MFFGHMAEVLALLVLGLLFFGPKRMIEMGGQLGKLWRETRDALKEMNWNPLDEINGSSSNSSGFSQSPLGRFSQIAQSFTEPRNETPATPPTDSAHVVESQPTPSGDTPTE